MKTGAVLSLSLLFGALAACAAVPPQPGRWMENYPEKNQSCAFYNATKGEPKAEGGKSVEQLRAQGMTGVYAKGPHFDKRCSYY